MERQFEIAASAFARISWWRVGVPVILLSAPLTLLYAPTLEALAQQWWNDPNYSHGFLVPVFSAFLIWQRRQALAGAPIRGSLAGLAILVSGTVVLLLGELGAELFLSRSSLLVILTGLVLFHLGWRIFQILFFPFAFLVFMVPLPTIVFNAVAFPLQHLAARNAAAVLDGLGVPILLDGNVIHLPSLTLGVTEACSGIRSLVSLLALATAWAHFSLPRGWARAVFIASAIPVAIVANAGRIVLTGLVGQWFGARYAEGVFHEFSGWLIFVVAFASLLALHGAIRVIVRRRHNAPRGS